MVIGYLDIFVFEEFVLALRPVVDGGDCILQADPGIVVPDEIYRGQHFKAWKFYDSKSRYALEQESSEAKGEFLQLYDGGSSVPIGVV